MTSRWISVVAPIALLMGGCGGTGLYAPTPVVTLPATPPASDSRVGTEVIPADQREPLTIGGLDTDGSPLSSADHLGDVVVVNAWASWCAPCREELPLLTQAHESFLDEGVIFLGLNVLDDPIGAAGLLASSPSPSIFDRDGALLATVPGVPPRSIPSTVVIDRQGRLAARIIGPVQPGQLEPLLAEIAAEA
ncbi:MAG: TlpA family protein disulfide reductase [Actinomycetota bacterium]